MGEAPMKQWGRWSRKFLVPAAFCFFLIYSEVFAGSQSALHIQISSTSLYPGDVALVSVAPAEGLASGQLLWEGKKVSLVPVEEKDILAAFFAVPYQVAPGSRKLSLALVRHDGDRLRRNLDIQVMDKAFPVQRLTLPKKKVTLSKTDLDRHYREKKAIENAMARPFDGRVWRKPFQRPVQGEVSTPFGVRRVLNGEPKSPHSGIDFRGRMGEPVAASSDGVVILTGEHFFAGKSVYVDHGMGMVTMYFHLSTIEVEQGDRVRAGQTIGLVGSTGRSTGPHLHWGLRVHNRPADPLTLLDLFPLGQ